MQSAIFSSMHIKGTLYEFEDERKTAIARFGLVEFEIG